MQVPGWSCRENNTLISYDILNSAPDPQHWIVRVFLTFLIDPHLRQDSINGVAALREHQVFVEHEVEGEGLAEGVGADPGLLRAVLLEAVQVLVEGLLLRVLLLNQELDVVALLAFGLDHLHRMKLVKAAAALLQCESLQAFHRARMCFSS